VTLSLRLALKVSAFPGEHFDIVMSMSRCAIPPARLRLSDAINVATFRR
jgi:hypothetical protein